MTEDLITPPPVLVAIPAANIYREDGKTYISVGGRACGPFEEVAAVQDLALIRKHGELIIDALQCMHATYEEADRWDEIDAAVKEGLPRALGREEPQA